MVNSYEPIEAVPGSAAVPGYTFNEDEDTGLFGKSANTIGIAAGGSEIASIASKAFAMGQNARVFFGSSSLADHGKVALPAHTVFMFGIVLAAAGTEFAIFYATPAGAITLVSETANVAAMGTGDGKLNIGLSNPNNPIEISNELGSTKDVNYIIVYY